MAFCTEAYIGNENLKPTDSGNEWAAQLFRIFITELLSLSETHKELKKRIATKF